MKATEAKLLDFLKKSPQFVIPIYQRTYSWTERECQQFWEDIIRAGGSDDVSAHFLGSVVYIERGLYQVSSQSPLLVIDGQQRLTSAMLLLEALARSVGDDEPIEGFSALKIRNYYLLNTLETGDRRFKLLLTQTDRDTLLAIVEQRSLPREVSVRVWENFDFFLSRVAGQQGDLARVCRGLAKLMVVDIALTRDQDNPQRIFESMNSTGRELSQADLIRNYVLMGLEPERQERLYREHWRPMEEAFGQEAYGVHFDSFIRHYLTLKTGEIPKVRAVYEAFKAFAESASVRELGVDALVAEVHRFADYYCAMALGSITEKRLARAFDDLRELRVDVAYPFLLELFADFESGVLGLDEFERVVRLVESYVFRRAICSIPTNSLNKTFAGFARALRKDRYVESVEAHLLLLPSYRRFPRDEEFQRDLVVRDLYNFPRRSYWLRRLENHGRKERVPVNEYTIEHIMPQNENLSSAWRAALGSEWRSVQEKYLHTIGNLTLTGYNAEFGDRSFVEKRDLEGGFRQSPLRLNEGLGGVETWDEAAIRERAARLSTLASEVWALPVLSPEQLQAYRGVDKRRGGYGVGDHPHLVAGGLAQSLFEVLRKELLAIDPCVTEEFLKQYVAFKAETNFIDVVPQKSGLRLSLNLRFSEVLDPRGVAVDVRGLGRWGNGDVEVRLSRLEDVPYVVGLARQAFDKQMVNGDEA